MYTGIMIVTEHILVKYWMTICGDILEKDTGRTRYYLVLLCVCWSVIITVSGQADCGQIAWACIVNSF